MLKWIVLLLGVLLLAALSVPVFVTIVENRQARDLEGREPYAPVAADTPRTAVVFFSRSGSTGLAARHIANRMQAALFEIEAQDYELGLTGWASAMKDARGAKADISPRTIDLSRYDTVYLGSPIWLYAPAPPIRAFVEQNRFDGKRVVLFNTYNSEFGANFIDDFRNAVMQRGARSFEHVSVRRGRMTQQIDPETMLEQIDAIWSIEPPSTANASNDISVDAPTNE